MMRSNASRKMIRRPMLPKASNDFTVEVLGRRYAVTSMKRQ